MKTTHLTFVFLASAILACLSGCGAEEPAPWAAAKPVEHRSELVGGPRAQGEIGDILLENDQIRLIVQGPGFSRGFGVYGGSIIDADLRRPVVEGDQFAGAGHDAFAEFFPAFFLQAMAVDTVEVISDGSDGGPARVRVSGDPGDFLQIASVFNRAVLGSHADYFDPTSDLRVAYSQEYELDPGSRAVRVTVTIENLDSRPLEFPDPAARSLLGIFGLEADGFSVPFGDILLYGALAKVFAPGVGFDMRFGLERSFERQLGWPVFDGIVTDFVASRGEHVSYGFIAEPSETNYVWQNRDVYASDQVVPTTSSILIPFISGSFTGAFHNAAPAELAPGESFSFVRYLVVGEGDVGSVLDEIHRLRGDEVGRFGGVVFDAASGAPVENGSVLVYRELPSGELSIWSQYDTHEGGRFSGMLTPGQYAARVEAHGRPLGELVPFVVSADAPVGIELEAPSHARVMVSIRDASGATLPAKAVAVGQVPAGRAGIPLRDWLFDLEAGQSWRTSDFIDDNPEDPDTMRFLETQAYTDDGVAELVLPPGRWEIVSSRGPEYDIARSTVTVRAGQTATVEHRLTRVMDTAGWIAADMHVHSVSSIDSSLAHIDRVRALAGEGVEWAVSTEHNAVSDLGQAVREADLLDWLTTSVGIELTTQESGHFNAYPLNYELDEVLHGSFQWADRTPDELFEALRERAADPELGAIVQVNHPRDDILGYFNQYERHGLTFEQVPLDFLLGQFTTPQGRAFMEEGGDLFEDWGATFSLGFDAMEVLNGKLLWEIHHFRMPESVPEGLDVPDDLPEPGTVLMEGGFLDEDVAWPGAVDDWFNLLNLGERPIGVGTGDTHELSEEPGNFRTMIQVATDDPRRVTEAELVEALRDHRAYATNAPILTFWVEDPERGGIGSDIEDVGDDGMVTVHVEVRAAPWVSLDRVNIFRNGLLVPNPDDPDSHGFPIDPRRDLSVDPFVLEIEVPLAIAPQEDAEGEPHPRAGQPIDSWFVVQAWGRESLFPVIRPQELPLLVLTDAISSLAGPLGLDDTEYGDLAPAMTFPIPPIAISNPVWVDVDGGGFDPPGIADPELRESPVEDPGFSPGPDLEALADKLLPPSVRPLVDVSRMRLPGVEGVRLFDPNPGNTGDVRFSLMPCHGRGSH